MYKKKFQKGEQVKDFNELFYLMNKGEWIYYRHKAYHPGWVQSWTFRFISFGMAKGWLYKADKIIKGD